MNKIEWVNIDGNKFPTISTQNPIYAFETKPEERYAYKSFTICETCIHFEVCTRILQKAAKASGICSDYLGFCVNCKFNNNGKCTMNSMHIKDTDFCSNWEEKINEGYV